MKNLFIVASFLVCLLSQAQAQTTTKVARPVFRVTKVEILCASGRAFSSKVVHIEYNNAFDVPLVKVLDGSTLINTTAFSSGNFRTLALSLVNGRAYTIRVVDAAGVVYPEKTYTSTFFEQSSIFLIKTASFLSKTASFLSKTAQKRCCFALL